MSFKWFKHLLVFVSLFCILESTGISLLSVLTKHKLNQTEQQLTNDDEGASERNESKENRLKELWPGDTVIIAPVVHIFINKVSYTTQSDKGHLAWVPPVPTPPPNSIV